MDLYRYFHPHHNPRLRNVAPRLQELNELEQAAIELRKAVQRTEIRAAHTDDDGRQRSALGELAPLLECIIGALHGLAEAHPGDPREVISQLFEERKDLPGWENWARLLKQQLRDRTSPADEDPESQLAIEREATRANPPASPALEGIAFLGDVVPTDE